MDGAAYEAGGGSDTGDTGGGWIGAGTTTWSGDTVDASETQAGETWECTVTPDDGDDEGVDATASVEIAEPSYVWEITGTGSVDMRYGSCIRTESLSATCDASTLGEVVYINASTGDPDALELWRLAQSHDGRYGARGSAVSVSSDGTSITWSGRTGCGGDYWQTDTVDIYECVVE